MHPSVAGWPRQPQRAQRAR